MTENSISLPLSSVATKNTLENTTVSKESSATKSFQSELDKYIEDSSSHDNSTIDKDKVDENKHQLTHDNQNASLIEKKQSSEVSKTETQSPSPANDGTILESEDDTDQAAISSVETLTPQDKTVNLSQGLESIIAAQTFNNSLEQQNNLTNSNTTVESNPRVFGEPLTNSTDAQNNKVHNNSLDQEKNIENNTQNKIKSDTVKYVDNDSEVQLQELPKPTVNLNTSNAPLAYAEQRQINNNIIGATAQSHALHNYPIVDSFYSDTWQTSLQQQVLMLSHNKIDSANIIINPDHLGPVHVSIQLDAQSQVSVQLWSQNAEVRQALRDSLPNLNSLFQDSGLQLGSADVGSQQNFSDSNLPRSNRDEKMAEEFNNVSDNEEQTNTTITVKNLVNVYI